MKTPLADSMKICDIHNETPPDISETVQQIALCRQSADKMRLFRLLTPLFPVDKKAIKKIRLLLFDDNAELRRECAYCLEPKNADDLLYFYALQDFDYLWTRAETGPAARELLFDGLRDKNLRLRAKILKLIHEKDCRDERENLLYLYGRTDYAQLENHYLEGGAPARLFIRELLQKGSREKYNMPYHRRLCALLLERLIGAEALEGPIRELLKVKPKKHSGPVSVLKPGLPRPLGPLELFLEKLKERGVWVDGQLTFPELAVGPATGRVTYRHPGLQTWPKEKRITKINPPQGYVILRFDYRAMEPSILLNRLLDKHLLSLEDLPDGDIYNALFPKDRARAKRYLNSLINGGPRLPDFNPGPFLWRLLPALDTLHAELRSHFNQGGTVETISGRLIALDKTPVNLSGKIMNRMVQGSAADFFNDAVLDVDNWINERHIDARVYFLLYDELWLLARPAAVDFVTKNAATILNRQYRRYGFVLPVSVKWERTEAVGDRTDENGMKS